MKVSERERKMKMTMEEWADAMGMVGPEDVVQKLADCSECPLCDRCDERIERGSVSCINHMVRHYTGESRTEPVDAHTDNFAVRTGSGGDAVDHPSHYAEGWSGGAEVIDIAEHLDFCRGNVVKYVARAGRKDPGKELEDLRKARWYLDREIHRLEEAAGKDGDGV